MVVGGSAQLHHRCRGADHLTGSALDYGVTQSPPYPSRLVMTVISADDGATITTTAEMAQRKQCENVRLYARRRFSRYTPLPKIYMQEHLPLDEAIKFVREISTLTELVYAFPVPPLSA